MAEVSTFMKKATRIEEVEHISLELTMVEAGALRALLAPIVRPRPTEGGAETWDAAQDIFDGLRDVNAPTKGAHYINRFARDGYDMRPVLVDGLK